MTQGTQTGALSQSRGVGWGGMEVQEGGDIRVLMADSHFRMAETNTTLKSNYPAIKINFKKWKLADN